MCFKLGYLGEAGKYNSPSKIMLVDYSELLHNNMGCTVQDFKSQFCVNFLSPNTVVTFCF